jgi:hypothetical protein
MPYVPLNVVLDRMLPVNGTVNLPYPNGRNEGYFFSGFNHTMSIDGAFFRCPRDFIISTQPDRIVMTWRGEFAIPSGAILNIQLEAPGGDFHFDQRTGVTVQCMVSAPLFLVNLSAPLAMQEEFFVTKVASPATKAFRINQNNSDCPRNILVHSDQDNEHCTFTIEGEDLYGRGMLERVSGPSEGNPSVGNKAFHKIHRITPSHPCNGNIWIGTGDKLGLPTFLPSPGYLIREIINGLAVTGGMIVSGETRPPSATTGDCRGTYTPPEDIILNGKHSVHLLLSLPNPGNIGFPDYTG